MRIDKETPRRHAAASDALLNAFASYFILDLTKGSATRYSRSLNRIEEARLESGIQNTEYRIQNLEFRIWKPGEGWAKRMTNHGSQNSFQMRVTIG
jgi:uncharacterized membrane protein